MDLDWLNAHLPLLAHMSVEGSDCLGIFVARLNMDQQITLTCNECGATLLTSHPQILTDLVSMIPSETYEDRPSPVLATATEFMLDTTALNRIVDSFFVETFRRMVNSLGVKLLLTHIQRDEIERAADGLKKDALIELANMCEVLPSSSAVYGVSRYGQATYGTTFGDEVSRIMIGNPRHAEDALIVNTAAARGCVLVMNDRATSRRAARVAPALTVVTFEEFLGELSRRTGGE